MKHTKQVPNNFLEKLIELKNQNLTDKEIGCILNKNHRTIGYHRKNLGLPASVRQIQYKNEKDRIKGYMIRNTKFMAKRRNIYFNLNYTDFDLPEFCPFLNIKLTFKNETSGNDLSHASLDRIDNNLGYIPGNVMVISRLANNMKSCASWKQLLIFSKNIIKFNKTQSALGNITDCSSLDS